MAEQIQRTPEEAAELHAKLLHAIRIPYRRAEAIEIVGGEERLHMIFRWFAEVAEDTIIEHTQFFLQYPQQWRRMITELRNAYNAEVERCFEGDSP